MTFLVSFFDGYSTLVDNFPVVSVSFFNSVKSVYMDILPLYEIGLGWIIPALIGAALGLIWPKGGLQVKKLSKTTVDS